MFNYILPLLPSSQPHMHKLGDWQASEIVILLCDNDIADV